MPFIKRFCTLFALLWLLVVGSAAAQCPMCRMSAEADLKNGGSATRALNQGIIYMLVMPYVMIFTVGFIWWRSRKNIAEAEQEDELRALLEPYDISLSEQHLDENQPRR